MKFIISKIEDIGNMGMEIVEKIEKREKMIGERN